MNALREVPPPDRSQLELAPLALLDALGGPVMFRVPGRERSRCRGLVTLLHGNEPSGYLGLLGWLRAARRPATDLLCVLASVDAARAHPGFGHRMLPGARDLNRCFAGPFDDRVGRLAADVLSALREARCESVLDLHNNTGPNPAYGVIRRFDPAVLDLVALFSRICVVTDLRLGALFETLSDEIPCAVIECGQAGDPAADATARAGITSYAELLELPPASEMRALDASYRVTLAQGATIAFSEIPQDDVHLTVLPSVERRNFERLAAGTQLGWIRGPWPLRVLDDEGRERSRELFEDVGGELRARVALMPSMVTARPEVAQQDCLCYLMRPHAPTGEGGAP